MNNDDRAKFEALKDPVHKAALVLLRHHLDNAEVHPCDWNDDNARAAQCIPEVQALHTALASAQAASAEPAAWRDHVEQRLLTWRQSFVNKSGDQLALDDFMDKRSLDDLIDFVCDEFTTPAPAVAPAAVTDPQVSEALGDARKAIKCLFLEAPAEVVAAAAAKVEWAFSMLQAARTPEPQAETQEDGPWIGCRSCDVSFHCYNGKAACMRVPQAEPSQTFVQTVPDKCDRIIWRGHYYSLPVAASPTPDEQTAHDSSYPECSGEPASCPENEGFGCCKTATVATDAQWCSCVPTRCEGVGRCRWHAMGYVPKALQAAQDEQRAQAAQEDVAPTCPANIIEAISAYGDARADGDVQASMEALPRVITLIRTALAVRSA